MVRVFIESRSFTRRVEILGGHELLLRIQRAIMADPGVGKVVPGLGGVRKLRLGDLKSGRGKRGAFRVFYLDLEEEALAYLLVLLDKTAVEDISPDEKRAVRQLVKAIKLEVRR